MSNLTVADPSPSLVTDHGARARFEWTTHRVSPFQPEFSERRQSEQVAGRRASDMPSDVEYSPVGEGLGMREYWLYVWLRRAAVIAAHITGLALTVIISVLSRPGTSKLVSTATRTSMLKYIK